MFVARQSSFARHTSHVAQEALGLLAYDSPGSSPLAHLLADEWRTNLFALVNRALLGSFAVAHRMSPHSAEHAGHAQVTSLEHVKQHIDTCLVQLRERKAPIAPLLEAVVRQQCV